MKILIIFLILSSSGYGCLNVKNVDDSNKVTFNLNPFPKITNLKLTDLGFVDIEYISLETKESSLFSCPNTLFARGKLIVGDRVYIVVIGNDILKFKDNGLFEKKIGTVGRGPNEYLVAHDVQLDKKTQEIYLLARWQKKFFVYSENGNLLRTFPITFSPNEFQFIDDKILCYSENHMGNIEKSYNLIDTNGIILKSFANKYPFDNRDAYVIQGENLFYHFNNQVFKKEVYSDTVFLYKNGAFRPNLVINVGEKLITPNARSQFDGLYLACNYISPLNLFEFGDYVYYEFVSKFDFSNTLSFGFIGSKKSGFQTLINPEKGLINDLDGGPNILPRTTKDDNTIIGWVDALQLKTHVASEAFKNSLPKYPEKKKALENLANSLKETDNPVLILIKLKK
jgi:hypothetical protein